MRYSYRMNEETRVVVDNRPTLPPGPADAAALEFARRAAREDTGPVALPGSARFERIASESLRAVR